MEPSLLGTKRKRIMSDESEFRQLPSWLLAGCLGMECRLRRLAVGLYERIRQIRADGRQDRQRRGARARWAKTNLETGEGELNDAIELTYKPS